MRSEADLHATWAGVHMPVHLVARRSRWRAGSKEGCRLTRCCSRRFCRQRLCSNIAGSWYQPRGLAQTCAESLSEGPGLCFTRSQRSWCRRWLPSGALGSFALPSPGCLWDRLWEGRTEVGRAGMWVEVLQPGQAGCRVVRGNQGNLIARQSPEGCSEMGCRVRG